MTMTWAELKCECGHRAAWHYVRNGCNEKGTDCRKCPCKLPQGEVVWRAIFERPALRDIIAGLISTVDFTPSQNHPQMCREIADAVLAVMRGE
jgi:hypothetical protein